MWNVLRVYVRHRGSLPGQKDPPSIYIYITSGQFERIQIEIYNSALPILLAVGVTFFLQNKVSSDINYQEYFDIFNFVSKSAFSQ